MIDDDLLDEFLLSDHGGAARNKVYMEMEKRHGYMFIGSNSREIKAILDAVGGEVSDWMGSSPTIGSWLGKVEELVASLLSCVPKSF